MEPAILKIRVKSSNQIDKAILDDGIRYEIKKLKDQRYTIREIKKLLN